MRDIALVFVGIASWALSAALSHEKPLISRNFVPMQAQSPSRTQPREFDAFSIKPSKPGAPPGGFQITDDGYQQSGNALVTAIMMAYLPMNDLSPDRVKNAPAWVLDDSYDILAKVSPENLTEWKALRQDRFRKPLLEKLLQSALAERCGLQAHYVAVRTDGYAIVAGKHGLQAKPSDPAEPTPQDASLVVGGGHVAMSRNGRQITKLTFYKTSISQLAQFLNQFTHGTPIVDQTGVPGLFDFTLTNIENTSDDANGESIDRALPWNLSPAGLKLSRIETTEGNIVIDSIHKPTPN